MLETNVFHLILFISKEMPSTFSLSIGGSNNRRLFSAGTQTQKLCLGFSLCCIPHLPSLHLDFLSKILLVCCPFHHTHTPVRQTILYIA